MIQPKSISPTVSAVYPLLGLLLLALLGGCIPPDLALNRTFVEPAHDPSYTARFQGFLVLKDEQGPAMRLEVETIELLGDDLVLPLTSGPLEIDSAALGTGQLFLGGVAVPPGRYRGLRMTITKAEVKKPDGQYAVITQESTLVEVNLPADLNIEAGNSQTLLMTWDVHNSVQNDTTLALSLTVASPLKQLPNDLVYVSCPDIDTVFVVRVDNNWVVDSFGLTGHPTYLAIDSDQLQQRLYVLAPGDQMVKVVDLSSYRVVDHFPFPLNDTPTFMTITPDNLAAYLLDERSGYITRMDLSSGGIEARVHLGYRPTYAVYLEEQNLLAVSLSLSHKVLLLDPVGLNILGTITTGSTPRGLAILNNQLYVAEEGDNTVSITDLASRGIQSRFTVGLGPRRLLVSDNFIYVSNYDDGSLSVLLPAQGVVFREVSGIGHPQEMADDKFFRRLFVTDEDESGLAVIDTNSNVLVGNIILGARPLGLDIIQ